MFFIFFEFCCITGSLDQKCSALIGWVRKQWVKKFTGVTCDICGSDKSEGETFPQGVTLNMLTNDGWGDKQRGRATHGLIQSKAWSAPIVPWQWSKNQANCTSQLWEMNIWSFRIFTPLLSTSFLLLIESPELWRDLRCSGKIKTSFDLEISPNIFVAILLSAV